MFTFVQEGGDQNEFHGEVPPMRVRQCCLIQARNGFRKSVSLQGMRLHWASDAIQNARKIIYFFFK